MKKKSQYIFLILLNTFIVFPGILRADYWTQKANYPGNGRSRDFCFSIADKGYFGCGEYAGNASDFWQYDTTANAWIQKASFGGGGRWSGVSFSVNGFGYAGLGWDATMMDDIWKYDPVADTWTQVSNFPAGQRQVPTSFVIGNFAYVATGRNNGNIFQNDLWKYDPVADTWTQMANLPGVPRSQPFAFSIDTLGYVGGGFDQALNGLNDFYQYDPSSNSWTTEASIPASGRGDPAGFAIGCKGYTGTGQTLPVNTVLNDLWEFDPSANQWTAKANFGGTARDESSFFTIGTKAYLGVGGINGGSLTNDFWEYTPDTTCIVVNPVAAFSAQNHICPGTCTNFTNLSLNGTSYLWTFAGANPGTSTDVNPSTICYNTPGNYSVSLITTNAFGSDTLTLNNYMTVYPFPAPQGIMQNGDTLFSNPGSTGYQWYYDGTIIIGATDYFYVATQNGDYSVVATDVNGCEVEAVIFNVFTGISAFNFDANIFTYSNPVENILTINVPGIKKGTPIQIDIYDALGRKEMSEQIIVPDNSHPASIELNSISQGLYYFVLLVDQKKYCSKFVKE